MNVKKILFFFALISIIISVFMIIDESSRRKNSSIQEKTILDEQFESNSKQLEYSEEVDIDEIEIMEREQLDINLGHHAFPLEKELNLGGNGDITILSNQAAIEVGMDIIGKYHEVGELPDFTLVSVIHYNENNIWCFIYSQNRLNEMFDGSVACYVVDGESGEILDAWIEE